jgi:hypothetical protein
VVLLVLVVEVNEVDEVDEVNETVVEAIVEDLIVVECIVIFRK